MKDFLWFGGQDGFRYQSLCSISEWMSWTACWRVPHPVRPKNQLWLQGTLILEMSRDLVIPVCQNRACGQGLPPVRLNFEHLELQWWNRFNKTWKNRHGSVQGKCCQKIREIFCLTLFWYSPTHQRWKGFLKSCDTILSSDFLALISFLSIQV